MTIAPKLALTSLHTSRSIFAAIVLGASLGIVTAGVAAPTSGTAPSPLTVTADLRLRYERDWDSQNAAGVARADRERARLRARMGFTYKLSEEWSFSARARAGSPESQQSPHLTFWSSDDTHDDVHVRLDRYFLQYKKSNTLAWVGRNGVPFWQQNEFFFDEDVTPTGIAGTYDSKVEHGNLTAAAGAFYLPDGMTRLNGKMMGAQLKYTQPVDAAQLVVAAGLHDFMGKDGAKNLRNRNGARDYLIGVVNAQWSQPIAPNLPLTLGADLFKNFENYSAADIAPLPANSGDETLGYVLSAQLGQLKKPHDWQLAYYYAHIETLAVNASYSEDDWARFGNAFQSDCTDIKGHEFRASYVITKSFSIAARLFLVEAITTQQDGKRCRVDLNWKY